MFKMDSIYEKLINLRNTFQVAKDEGSETPDLGHFVFQVLKLKMILWNRHDPTLEKDDYFVLILTAFNLFCGKCGRGCKQSQA